MKTITIEIGALEDGYYPLRLCEETEAEKKVLAVEARAIPEDLRTPGEQKDPKKFAEFILTKTGERPELKGMGETIFQLLASGTVGQEWKRLRSQAEPLRTLLDVKPEELQSVPWELAVMDEKDEKRLSLDTKNPFLRAYSYRRSTRVDPVSWPLRLLVIVASRDDKIKVDEELRQIEEALRPVNRTIDVEPIRLPSKAEMLDKIDKYRPHILHFAGHSGQTANVNPDDKQMVLWLELRAGGDNDFWTAGEILGDLERLSRHGPLPRFVFLNSCRSSNAPSLQDQKSTLSISKAFRDAGVPAVLAMQADVLGELAGRLAGKIYEMLSKGEPLDVALAEGRNEVRSNIKNSLITREWALPVLTVSISPDDVLPIKPQITDEKKVRKLQQCPKFLEVIPPFVNRKVERRGILQSFYPILPEPKQNYLAIVHGESEIGKSWITCWCMDGYAWQGHNIRYIEVVKNKSKDWLDILLRIRDGDEEDKDISLLHEPLDPEAFHDFNWELHHRLRGQTPPLRNEQINEQIIEPPRRMGKDKLVSSNKDFVEQIFSSFYQALQRAAGNEPLIMVFDQFTRGTAAVDTASMQALVRKLFIPVAQGKLEMIKIVMVLTKEEMAKYKIAEKLQGLYADLPLKMLEGETFTSLAAEFLRLKLKLKDTKELHEVCQVLINTRAQKIKEWKPSELKSLYQMCEQALEWTNR